MQAPRRSRSKRSFDLVAADYRRAVRFVGEQFTDPSEDWAPTLLLEGRDGRVVVGLAGEFLETPEVKDALADAIIPTILEQAGATMYGLVFSAWTVSAETGALISPRRH